MSQLRRIEERPLPRTPRHIPGASQDTNASGIADSTISFGTLITGESLRLSQFPNPPSQLPLSPIQSEFGTPSPSRSTFSSVPYRKAVTAASVGTSQGSTSNGETIRPTVSTESNSHTPSFDTQRRDTSPLPPSSRDLSPYDWHEGASRIDVDATEDRLLSTSFITSLLQENAGPYSRRGQRASTGSDGLSGYSEMTYPPPSRYLEAFSPGYHAYLPQSQSATPLTRSQPSHRPYGDRPPPSAFVPVSNTSRRMSGDSDTLHSNQDHNHVSVVRTASLSPGFSVQGASVVGIAPATIRNLSVNNSLQASSNKERTSAAAFGRHYGDRESAEEADEHKLDMPEYNIDHSLPYIPSLPSATGTQPQFLRDNSRTRQRQSTHSTKSYVPSFLSRLSSGAKSGRSITRAFHWLRMKPLPPVPVLPHIPTAAELEHRKAEESMPLPDLVNRAGTLSHLLDKGHHRHQRLGSYSASSKGEALTTAVEDLDNRDNNAYGPWQSARGQKPQRRGSSQKPWTSPLDSPKIKDKPVSRKKKRMIVIVSCFFAVALITVGVTAGITVSRKGHHLTVCTGNLTGASCNLDATCVCTSSLPGRCDSLAQNLVDLTPTMNRLFSTNVTVNSLSNALWVGQGTPNGDNCASQSVLVDVAPALDSNKFRNRTQWAQSALLWNLVQSQDLVAVAKMQKFVVNAAWGALGDSDGPVSNGASAFSITSSGFVFNFATQTVTNPNVSYVNNGQPTSSQIAQVGTIARSALDRMYSYALASSTQRQQAMFTYWRTVLQQKPEDLAGFMSAFSSSPILIPFDATFSRKTQSLATMLTNSSTSPFPPPLACYPGLNSTQVQRINTIENSVFGLSSMSTATQFDPSCFPDRPLYGVLDVLRLRLPFIDSRTDVAKQAAVLKRDVAPRVVVYSGEILSPLPGLSNFPDITMTQTDPRQYGTLNHLNHVVLTYLSAIPDVNVAIALVTFVLTSHAVPPTNSSILPESLASIPPIEVAIFGSIEPSDISSAVSSFSTPSNSIFFGSDQADALRQWAITGTESSIAWTEFAISPLVVRDSSFTDTTFNQAWTAASTFLHHNMTGVDVSNITTSFKLTGKFSP